MVVCLSPAFEKCLNNIEYNGVEKLMLSVRPRSRRRNVKSVNLLPLILRNFVILAKAIHNNTEIKDQQK